MAVSNRGIRATDIVVHYPSIKIGGLNALFKKESREKKSFGLSGISFEVKTGDRVALIGLNGAGKSTLLKVLAGVFPLDSGSLDVNGSVFSMFGSGVGIKPNLTGKQNVELRSLFYGIFDRAVAQDKIEQVKDFSELGEKFYHPVSTYSSGMKARLAFSMILMIEPDILLIDEALGTGDAKFLAKTKQYSKNLISKANMVIQASHSERFLKSVCNKALWLHQGRLMEFGEIDSVFEKYNSFSIEK